MNCSLCGYQFEEVQMACHNGCPFKSRCKLVCCPKCGYQVPDSESSVMARWLDRVLPKKKKTEADLERARRVIEDRLVPLSHIETGKGAIVRRVDDLPDKRLARLTVFGLAPGHPVRVIQRSPAPVIRIGETELALGTDILDQIWVTAEA